MYRLIFLLFATISVMGCTGNVIQSEGLLGANKKKEMDMSAPVFCTTSRSVVARGEKVDLIVWDKSKTDSQTKIYTWETTSGEIRSVSGTYQWELTGLEPGEYTAYAYEKDNAVKVVCAVYVTIKQQLKGLARRSLLSHKPKQIEEPGFGAYSYILFNPPLDKSDFEKQKIILESYLEAICEINAIDEFRLKEQINIVFIPVKTLPDDSLINQCGINNQKKESKSKDRAKIILDKFYDYNRSTYFMELLGKNSFGGPYLITTKTPISNIEELTGDYVEVDLTNIPEHIYEIIPKWMATFFSISGQEREWSQEKIKLFAYRLRVGIAIIAQGVNEIESGISRLVKLRDNMGKLIE